MFGFRRWLPIRFFLFSFSVRLVVWCCVLRCSCFSGLVFGSVFGLVVGSVFGSVFGRCTVQLAMC